jgi:hypothetical protein
MARIHSIYRYIPRRYGVCLLIIFIVCPSISFLFLHHSPELNVHVTAKYVEVTDKHVDEFDLYDDDDMRFVCPLDIQFDIKNRQHLAIILAAQLKSFIWKNFRALLCSGIDVYIMFDEIFRINSPLRVDSFKSRTSRSKRSYSHRFLYVKNEYLVKFGVRYMKKLPSVEFTSWDRAVVWLYHRANLNYAWILEEDVQWFNVRNMTYLFDSFVNDTTDVLCDNIVPTNSFWGQWPRKESDIFPKVYWLGTFSPMVRWSRRLLEHHYRYMQMIHPDRLKYELHTDYRFQEFIMSTIAKTENLAVKEYSKNNPAIHIVLGNMSDREVLDSLRMGRHILHPVKQESILTKYRTEHLVEMIKTNRLNLINMTLL